MRPFQLALNFLAGLLFSALLAFAYANRAKHVDLDLVAGELAEVPVFILVLGAVMAGVLLAALFGFLEQLGLRRELRALRRRLGRFEARFADAPADAAPAPLAAPQPLPEGETGGLATEPASGASGPSGL